MKINDNLEMVIEQYKNQPVAKLFEELNISNTAKNRLNTLTKKIMERSSSPVLTEMSQEDEFCFKTIKLDKFGRLKESMSLPAFKFCNLVTETWKNSKLRTYFANQLFAFTVFKETGQNLFLQKIILWKMPEKVLDRSVRTVWERMQDCLTTGRIVKYIDDYGRYFSYFPSSSDNPYVHVRPHVKNRNDTYELPVADKLTGLIQYPKHSFWINRAYILKIIERDESCV